MTIYMLAIKRDLCSWEVLPGRSSREILQHHEDYAASLCRVDVLFPSHFLGKLLCRIALGVAR